MRKLPRIIGLTGRAGVGKDTVADHLCNLDPTRLRFAFAAALRDEVAAAWSLRSLDVLLLDKEQPRPDLSLERCKNDEFVAFALDKIPTLTETNLLSSPCRARTARWIMQTWGDYRRKKNPAHWLAHAAEFVKDNPDSPIVITDIRLQPEADWCRAHGGEVWQIRRPDAPAVQAHLTERDNIHPDLQINNSGGLPNLAHLIRAICDGSAIHVPTLPTTSRKHHSMRRETDTAAGLLPVDRAIATFAPV